MSYDDIRWVGAGVERKAGAGAAAEAGSEAGDVVDADKWSVRVVMSTDQPVGGRAPEEGDVIPQDRWDLRRWERGGRVVLDGHYMGPGMCGGQPADVVGNGDQAERDVVDGPTGRIHRTLTTVRWSRLVPRAELLAGQYHNGERRDFSVGFHPGDMVGRGTLAEGHPYRVDPTWSENGKRKIGRLLTSPRLYELSPVTIGADDEATAVRAFGGQGASGLLTWGERRSAFVRAALTGLDDDRQRAEAVAVLRELAADPAGWALIEAIHRQERARRDPLIRALAELSSR